jgi:hypothetical protein
LAAWRSATLARPGRVSTVGVDATRRRAGTRGASTCGSSSSTRSTRVRSGMIIRSSFGSGRASGRAETAGRGAGAAPSGVALLRRRITVPPATERRSVTVFSAFSRSYARLIRATSSGSRADMWFLTSIPIARTLSIRSLFWRPRSFASS